MTEKKGRGRKKRETMSQQAKFAVLGVYGKGNIMRHRLIMNYGRQKAAEIIAEVDKYNKGMIKIN